MEEKLWYIKSSAIFSALKPEEQLAIGAVAKMTPFHRGEIIYLPDDLSNYVYLIKKGRVKLSRVNDDGREVTLDILGRREIFGELAMAEEATRSHMATALEDGLMCIFTRVDFQKIMARHSSVTLKVVKLIGLRMRKLESRLEDLAFRSVSERVNGTLLRLAEEFGSKESNGAIRVPITQSQLAYLVGASREKVAEELGKLRREGLLSTAYRSIVLQNFTEGARETRV
ncbi:MAG: Crp/Fnr family transcriptional regulator [Desulfovibrionales bacterium]|nr:MAG: Crp/Fnr family transcriptional regulator [Desulfovibrionales bacterium]